MLKLQTWQALSLVVGVALAAPAYVGAAEDTREIEESAGGEEKAAESLTERAEPTRTLAERIPSVTHRVFLKKGRLELLPSMGMTLNDPFYNNVVVSAGLMYHVLEWLAVGVASDYYVAMNSNVAVYPVDLAHPNVDHPTYGARLEVAFSPLYGKLSLFAEKVLHFDTYLVAGGGVIGTSRTDPTLAGVVGIGQHYFLDKWISLRAELRDQLFSLSRNAAAPDKGKNLQNLLSFTLGVCFYLPADFEHEAL